MESPSSDICAVVRRALMWKDQRELIMAFNLLQISWDEVCKVHEQPETLAASLFMWAPQNLHE